MSVCFAECLDLIPLKNKCKFSRSSGIGALFSLAFKIVDCFTAVGDICAKEFFPAKNSKFVLCEYKFIDGVVDESRM